MTTRTYSRYTAIGLVIDFLTERETQRIQSIVNRLSQSNSSHIGQPSDGFLYKGVFYEDTSSTTRYREKHILHDLFWGEMKAVQRDRDAIHTENQKMSQGLLLLFKSCESWQDVRDALPDFLAPALLLNPPLERTRPEGWSMQGNPAREAAYQSIRDMLEVRSAARLIY